MIRSVLFHTHYECNFNCEHCYEKKLKRRNVSYLSIEEKKNIIKKCLKLGAISFDFVSGESILDPNLPELIKTCKPRRTFITLATNGYNYNEEILKELYGLGIDKLNISIDSWYADEHDTLRKKPGAHENALKTLGLCQKIGLGVNITVFVYKDFTHNEGFKKLVDYSIKNKIGMGFKLAIPLGAIEGNYDMLITKKDKSSILKLCEKYSFLKTCHLGNRNGGCPAFDEVITITAYGDILPCNAIHITFGNVQENDLQSIIEKGRKIRFFNGNFQGCPPAENHRFIESILSKSFNSSPYPIEAEKIFDELKNGAVL
ncbi:MAG: radical SAM protein [archaeon]|nr:radical SAM protein [archaeon]